ncbi:MAG: hypothetical protein C0483_12065 [Pirellula sp.]|nr:hypothetical protein [Pirellula sp.]
MMSATLLLLTLGAALAADAGSPTITVDGEPTRVIVSRSLTPEEVAKLGADGPIAEPAGRAWLTLSLVGDAAGRPPTPMFGSYELRGGKLLFRPRFVLVRGAAYEAESFAGDGPRSPHLAAAQYAVPMLQRASTTVVAGVSPHLPTLPANVLKFYVTFSAPMRQGRVVLEQVRLLDAGGKELVAPWRDLELWNADATRLSLFVHPGRIKQGVNLRDDFGPVLEPGKQYTLVVGTDLVDGAGMPLARAFRYSFTTAPELRSRVDVAAWSIAAPKSASREPLVVTLDRPLDRHLALRALTLVDDTGQDLLGRAEVSDDGRRWTWTPTTRWTAGGYTLKVDPVLEDLCGNSPLRAFDHDLEAEQVDVLPPLLERVFEIE